MGIALGLLAALFYGASDFAAGVGGRRASSAAVAIMSQPIGLIASIIAVLALPASLPSESALAWGAASGFGGGMGTIALYRGLTVGSMGVVAPLSAVLAAALPAMIGIATGDSLSSVQVAGLALALPGIALISLQSPGPVDSGRAGVAEGLLAGAGFALLFIGLARAGTSAGAWPLVPCQAMAVATVLALGLGLGQPAGTWAGAWLPAVITGVLGGGANLLYLAATGKGQLSIVAVLTALYPAVTILLARGLLHEHWTRVQVVGLALSAVAIGLISVG
jgi:uncharacterized membrane protein